MAESARHKKRADRIDAAPTVPGATKTLRRDGLHRYFGGVAPCIPNVRRRRAQSSAPNHRRKGCSLAQPMDEADVYLSVAPGASEYRFANGVVVDGSDTMIYLDFSQIDPKIDDRAVSIARIAIPARLVRELMDRLSAVRDS